MDFSTFYSVTTRKSSLVSLKRIALIGSPILQSVNNLMNAAIARHAEQVGNWDFIYSAKATVEAFRFLRTLECDGAIVRVISPAMRREALKVKFPIVNISSWLEHPQVPTVRTDWRLLGRLAAEYLLGKGFRGYGVVMVPGGWFVQERSQAFLGALGEQGVTASLFHLSTTQPNLPNPITKEESNRFRKWVGATLSRPAALVLMDDWDAPRLMDLCREAGLQIPRDLAVLSIGIHSEVLPLCNPSLSGAQEDLEKQADWVIQSLEALMAGKKVSLTPIVVPPLGIVERVSTSLTAIENRDVAHAVEFIRRHGNEPCNVEIIAQKTSVCRATLERHFLKHMGVSLHEYLIEHRIEHAKKLLSAQPPLSLESIAKQCGIPDRRRLNRVFKNATGQLPEDYRLTAQNTTA